MKKPTKPKHRRAMQRQVAHHCHYTLVHELMASPTQPLPEAHRVHHLTRMWQGLAAIEKAAAPTTEDWRLCSDAVNMMETFTTAATGWLDCTGQAVLVTDASGLVADAVAALAMAGKRHRAGGAIRLDAVGIQAVRAILEDYAALLEALPARQVVRCHRLTEKRIAEILVGKCRPHDVEVMDL